ncbi:MAG: ferritin-like domain-containing protein, partial [Chloroflexota bacterium]
AINEMQHLGWLAEKIVSISASPRIEHTELDQSTTTPDMLRADIRIEQEVAAAYDRAAGETTDPELKKLFIRLRDHEIYHTEVFNDLLGEKEEEEKPG